MIAVACFAPFFDICKIPATVIEMIQYSELIRKFGRIDNRDAINTSACQVNIEKKSYM